MKIFWKKETNHPQRTEFFWVSFHLQTKRNEMEWKRNENKVEKNSNFERKNPSCINFGAWILSENLIWTDCTSIWIFFSSRSSSLFPSFCSFHFCVYSLHIQTYCLLCSEHRSSLNLLIANIEECKKKSTAVLQYNVYGPEMLQLELKCWFYGKNSELFTLNPYIQICIAWKRARNGKYQHFIANYGHNKKYALHYKQRSMRLST